jgi:hypothetical protein
MTNDYLKIFTLFAGAVGVLLLVMIVIVLVVPMIGNDNSLPINGNTIYITVDDVVSYGVAGHPPCLETLNYDCIVGYEYVVKSTDGDYYRIDKEMFPERYTKSENLKIGSMAVVSCDYMSHDSRDYPRDENEPWKLMVSNRNYFFGCEVSTVRGLFT